jgi:hypothetical protein
MESQPGKKGLLTAGKKLHNFLNEECALFKPEKPTGTAPAG